MSDIERILTWALILALCALTWFQAKLTEGWKSIALSRAEMLSESHDITERALALVDESRELTDSVVISASNHRLISRGIDPRRDALWPPIDCEADRALGQHLIATQPTELETLS